MQPSTKTPSWWCTSEQHIERWNSQQQQKLPRKIQNLPPPHGLSNYLDNYEQIAGDQVLAGGSDGPFVRKKPSQKGGHLHGDIAQYYIFNKCIWDGQHRNRNMNNKDNLVGRLATSTVTIIMMIFSTFEEYLLHERTTRASENNCVFAGWEPSPKVPCNGSQLSAAAAGEHWHWQAEQQNKQQQPEREQQHQSKEISSKR